MSVSLFGTTEQVEQPSYPLYSTKNQLFRQQIRRRQNNEKFRVIRQEFLQSLKSLQFLEDLKSERDNYTPKRIQELVSGLEMGLNNASFYQNILDMGLDHYLCDMFSHPDLKIKEQTQILHTLVQLTYFCASSPQAMVENNIIDLLMRKMRALSMDQEIDQSFAFYAATLVYNLTTIQESDLNNYIMESDFMKILEQLVEKSSRREENLVYYRSDLREVMLKIYSSLFSPKIDQEEFICKSLFIILNDHRNSENEHVLPLTLSCLEKAAHIPGVWRALENQKFGNYGQFFSQIIELASVLVHFIKKGQPMEKSIENFIEILNGLYDQEEFQCQAADCFIQELGTDFLLLIMDTLHKKSTGGTKRTLCKIFKMLSYALLNDFSQYQLTFKVLFPTKTTIDQFLQTLICKHYIANPVYGKYSIRLLYKLLEQDKTTLDIMLDHGIYDGIRDILDFEFLQQTKIEIIELIQRMIEVEETMKSKEEGGNKLVEVFHQRGIIRDIQKLQDHNLRQLFKKAESFMNWLAQVPRTQ